MKTRSTLRRGIPPETVTLDITVRSYGGTYIARCNGKSASCTMGEDMAALAVAKKAGAVLQEMGVISADFDFSYEAHEAGTGIDLWEFGSGRFQAHCGPAGVPHAPQEGRAG